MNEQRDVFGQLRELERRLFIVETAARVPQVSSLTAGAQFANFGSGTSYTKNTSTTGDLQNPFSFADVPGPTVTITVPQTGRMVLIFGCQSRIITDATQDDIAWMTYELSGANTVAADHINNETATHELRTNSAEQTISLTQAALLDGLNPGETVVACKYKRSNPSAPSWTITQPWLFAIPL